MEAAKFAAGNCSKLCPFPGNDRSCWDQEVAETSSSVWSPNSQQKRKRDQLGGNDDPSELLTNAKGSTDNKNKQPMGYEKDFEKQAEDFLVEDLICSSTCNGSEYDAHYLSKGSGADAEDYSYLYDYGDEENEEEGNEEKGNEEGENEDEENGDEDDEYDYDTDLIYDDSDFNLAAKFDELDLPPGVEATVPWLQKIAPEEAGSKKPMDDDIERKIKSFKKFDTVQDYSDHHYIKEDSVKSVYLAAKPPKSWVKRVQHEWKILEKDLPDTIFVRVYEERMDLLRAVIIGPAGTPYHDCLFFFDLLLPSDYPDSPPLAYYHSGGLRLNPNLYSSGKVCLSLLGTWSGKDCEKWKPGNSTILQVLVSIQALVLNEKPYFNEPGYELSAGTARGEKEAKAYNEEAFLLSCKTMMYAMRKPPKNFEDFVAGHFCKHGHTILGACKAYMDGAKIGFAVGDGGEEEGQGEDSTRSMFRCSLEKIYEDLLMEFTVKGADCAKFLAQKVKAGLAKQQDTALKLQG